MLRPSMRFMKWSEWLTCAVRRTIPCPDSDSTFLITSFTHVSCLPYYPVKQAEAQPPVKKFKEHTPVSSDGSSPPSSDEENMDLLTNIRETPKDHKAAKSQVSCQPSFFFFFFLKALYYEGCIYVSSLSSPIIIEKWRESLRSAPLITL